MNEDIEALAPGKTVPDCRVPCDDFGNETHTDLDAISGTLPNANIPSTYTDLYNFGDEVLFDNKIDHNRYNPESLVNETIFEVPLLESDGTYLNVSENIENNQHTHLQLRIENDAQKYETNSDSTEEYTLNASIDDIQPNKNEVIANGATISSSTQSFSPLPSTSRDYDIMNLNDMMFKGEVRSPVETKLESSDEKVMVDVSQTEKCEAKRTEELSIVECSSGSENEDVICCERKPSFIDLSNDDAKSDSDCEIVDVDNILSENNKVLSVTQVSSPSKCDSVEIISPNSNSLPLPLLVRPDVEIVTELTNPTPFAENYYPILSELKSFLEFIGSAKPPIQNEMLNAFTAPSGGDSLPCTNSQISPRSVRKRNDEGRRKRRRIEPNNSSPSDVIVIDVDSPVNVQRSNNVAQISVSIVAPPPPAESQPMQSNIINPIQSNIVDPTQSNTVDPSLCNIVDPQIDHNYPIPPLEPSDSTSNTRRLGDCPVCLENFSKVKPVSTFCGHLFCKGCITTVKKSSNKCPTCRKRLRGVGYHPIFL